MPSTAHKEEALFAEFGVRLAAIALELYIAMFLIQHVHVYVFDAVSLTITDYRLPFFAVLFLYFAAFWSSPMQATPVQYVFCMRVVDEAGERVSLGRAALRSALLVVLIVATIGDETCDSRIHYQATSGR